MDPVIEISGIKKSFGAVAALKGVDLTFYPGEVFAIVGDNGAGKSTLFKGVVGVIKPLTGRIERNGVRPEEIAYLPQVAEIDRSFPISVYDMVAMGLWRRTGLFGGGGSAASML